MSNQTVQQLLQTHAEEFEAGSTNRALSRFEHDFSSIPIHPPSVGAIQPKLTISKAGDEYEQEADQISEQVMRMPKLQRTSTYGGGYPTYQTKQLVSEPEHLQTKHVESGDQGQTKAPSIVHEILSSAGQPFHQTTRSFMEERFGYDFGHVRTHTDARAEEAARAVRARAFTVDANIVFGHNQFAPETAEGQRLIAHELTHVIQQRSASNSVPHEQSNGLSISATPSRISRSPSTKQDLHSELIEQFRGANGLPPHGIDPVTGQQVGPTDSEIRFGGLLERWLLANRPPGQTQAPGTTASPTQTPPAQAPATTVRGVPAPTQAPNIIGPGNTSVVAACQNAVDRGACLQHHTYVLNILPQAIANIRSVSSPYSAAIANLYAATLPAAQAAAAPTPWGSPNARFGASVDAAAGPVTVTFGATTFTFNRFTISLQQQTGGANGQAFGAGGPIAFINLNEASNDALLRNIAGIEATMIHETMHIFMEIIEGNNRGRTAGTPPVDSNLDRTSYATLQTSLENALLPFITQIRQLPSFTGAPATGSTQQDTISTARSFLSETIARTEAGIFAKQRAGQAFAATDLRALPPFIHASDYWFPTPPVPQELKTFIQTNQTQIDAAIQPIIYQVGERYLNLRP